MLALGVAPVSQNAGETALLQTAQLKLPIKLLSSHSTGAVFPLKSAHHCPSTYTNSHQLLSLWSGSVVQDPTALHERQHVEVATYIMQAEMEG